jgi:RimJ/RimL family protein N-acetyltransferase
MQRPGPQWPSRMRANSVERVQHAVRIADRIGIRVDFSLHHSSRRQHRGRADFHEGHMLGIVSLAVTLETERLILRSTTREDTVFVAAMYADAEVCCFLGGVKTPQETTRKIHELIEHEQRHGFARWSVTLKSNGEPIGLCGPMLTEVEGVPEIELGYSLIRSCWGQAWLRKPSARRSTIASGSSTTAV